MKVIIFFALVAFLAIASASVIGPIGAPLAVGHLGLGLPVASVQVAGLHGSTLVAGPAVHGILG